ncbi:MAG: CD1871A family CXXC motif-containing protein [Roseburia sp.]
MISGRTAGHRPSQIVLILKKQGIGAILLALGVLSLLYGIHRQEHLTVEKKSNLICLECIGIS